MRLEGKIAIVTGGSSGIGYEVVKQYALEGAKVYLCGISIENAKEACNKMSEEIGKTSIIPVALDVTKDDDIKSLEEIIKKEGRLDILVNNAGITFTKSILEISDEEYHKVMDINSTGTMKMIRTFAPYMKEKGGSIINTSSMVGTYASNMQSAYSASKFAVNGITKSCAKELGQYNIRVNAVAPGVVETPMVAGHVTEEMKQKLIFLTPLRRTATPKDLYGIYIFLATDEASFITSAIIPVDGGIVM